MPPPAAFIGIFSAAQHTPATPWAQPMDHTRVLTLTDPDATADAIARAATRALTSPGA
jgi:hypothetical protein